MQALVALWGVRRFRCRIAVQIAVKPIQLPVQALDQVLWLASPCQVVVLPGKKDDLRRHAEMLQSSKPLLALFDRNTKVVVRMENKRRRSDVVRIFQRRSFPVLVEVVKNNSLEIVSMAVSPVSRPIVADKI